MTPADICDRCNGCRSIHQCRQKCGLEPAARIVPPPPASRWRNRLGDLADCAAVLLFPCLILLNLYMAGAL